jgi:hypothetical protein
MYGKLDLDLYVLSTWPFKLFSTFPYFALQSHLMQKEIKG